jgi:hypothetical protein
VACEDAGPGVALDGGWPGAGRLGAGGLGNACCPWTTAGPETTIRATQPAPMTWENHFLATRCRSAMLADFDSILFTLALGTRKRF